MEVKNQNVSRKLCYFEQFALKDLFIITMKKIRIC